MSYNENYPGVSFAFESCKKPVSSCDITVLEFPLDTDKPKKTTKFYNKKNNKEGRCAGYGICYTCTRKYKESKCRCTISPYNKPCLVKSTLKKKVNEGMAGEHYLYFCANCSERGLFALDNRMDCLECAEPI